MWETMGPIADRSQERLGVSDTAILQFRRIMVEAAHDFVATGRVIGKSELLDHVWASATDVAPNAVEVYVGYLRRKIGNNRLITVRGVGYRLAS